MTKVKAANPLRMWLEPFWPKSAFCWWPRWTWGWSRRPWEQIPPARTNPPEINIFYDFYLLFKRLCCNKQRSEWGRIFKVSFSWLISYWRKSNHNLIENSEIAQFLSFTDQKSINLGMHSGAVRVSFRNAH